MSLIDLLTLPCTITSRAPGDDRDTYGNEVPSTTTTITVCELQQQSRDERDDEISATTWLAIFPAGTVLGTDDTLTIGTASYEVRGAPWAIRSPWTGAEHHVEATLVRAAGTDDVAEVPSTGGLVLELVTEYV